MLCSRRVRRGLARLRFMNGIEDGESDIDADTRVVVLEALVVQVVIIELRKQAVLRDEVDLWSPEITRVAERNLLLGLGDGIGGFHRWTGHRKGRSTLSKQRCKLRDA